MTTRLAWVLAQKPAALLVQFCEHDLPETGFVADGLPYWIGGYPEADFIDDDADTLPPSPITMADDPTNWICFSEGVQTGLAFVTWNPLFRPRPAQYERQIKDKRPFRPRRKTLEANKRRREEKKIKKSTQYRLL